MTLFSTASPEFLLAVGIVLWFVTVIINWLTGVRRAEPRSRSRLDPAQPFPVSTLGQPRGRPNSPGKVYLPDGWLADRDSDDVPAGAEMDDSGG